MRLFRLESQTQRSRKQFFIDGFIKDAADVAVVVELDTIARIFQRRFSNGENTLAILNQRLRAGFDVVHGVTHRGNSCQEQHLRGPAASANQLCRHFCSVRPINANRPGRASRESHVCFDDVFALNVQRVVDDDGVALCLRVQARGNGISRAG